MCGAPLVFYSISRVVFIASAVGFGAAIGIDALRITHYHLVNRRNAKAKPEPNRAKALIALTCGMLPSIPNRRGASPKPTWRQTQADVAPNPNLCQLFPIATHCRFEPFQGLGLDRKRRPAFAPCRPCPFPIKPHAA